MDGGIRERDERLGMNVRALREQAGMSQSGLAEAMRERGHPWHQQTVARAERGAQGVRWAEACDLAAILETSLERLTWGSAEANAVGFFAMHRGAVRRSAAAVSDAVLRLLTDLGRGAGAAQMGAPDTPRTREAREDLLAVMEEWDLDAAVEDGIARHAELGDAP